MFCFLLLYVYHLPQAHTDSAADKPPTFALSLFLQNDPKTQNKQPFCRFPAPARPCSVHFPCFFHYYRANAWLIYSSTDGAAVPGRSATKWVGCCSGPREQQPSDNAPRPQQQRLSEQRQFAPAGDGLRFLKQEFGALRDGEGPANEYGEASWGE